MLEEANALYQGVLSAPFSIDGKEWVVVGVPDFMILAKSGYRIRDAKISRRISEKDHPEILRQLELYGWLYEQVTGRPPFALEVLSGTGDIINIPYDGGKNVLTLLTHIVSLKTSQKVPYSPVGWSKCSNRQYKWKCWPEAEKRSDISLVAGVDQGLASALKEINITTIDQFLNSFTDQTLTDFKRPYGQKSQKVGKAAPRTIKNARALVTGEMIKLIPPQIPNASNYVMSDIEGLPSHLNELEKMYLWGLKVYGKQPSDFLSAAATFGADADVECWKEFLKKSAEIFSRYGDIPFVHWATYEKTNLRKYVERYGDPEGVAARVEANLLDLLPIVKASVVLPLSSYSLKVVEKYIGYKRTLPETNGNWAMAKYIEAVETNDEEQRKNFIADILVYNEEDLDATWAVFRWLTTDVFES